MGIICHPKETSLDNYSTKSQNSMTLLQSKPHKIQFITQSAPIDKSQCLVLFIGEDHNFSQNQYLKTFDDFIIEEIREQFCDVIKRRKTFEAGDCILLKINSSRVNIKNIAVIGMEKWLDTVDLRQPIEDDLELCLQLIKEQKTIKRIMITNLDDENIGIPPKLSAKFIGRLLIKDRYYEQIKVYCRNQESQQTYEEVYNKLKELEEVRTDKAMDFQ